jgi:hypothetical protein
LQDAHDEVMEDEEHEEEEESSDYQSTPSTPNSDHDIDKPERHPIIDKFIYDAFILSTNDSHYVETDLHLPMEALCLDTHMENINDDELDINYFSTNNE